MAVSMIGPKFYAWDRNGKPLAGGKLYTYQARTNTPKATYQSEDQEVENTNPVILNGEGYANVYLDGSYKMVLKDSKDAEIWSSDPVTSAQANEWTNCFAATYVGPNAFKVAGNQTDIYIVGRTLRINNNAAEYEYTQVQSAVYAAGETSVVVTDAVITTGLNSVCTSVVSNLSHNSTSDRNAVGAHDEIYTRKVYLSAIPDNLIIGTYVQVVERDNARFLVSPLAVMPNEYNAIGFDNFVLELDEPFTLSRLGVETDADISTDLNNIIAIMINRGTVEGARVKVEPLGFDAGTYLINSTVNILNIRDFNFYSVDGGKGSVTLDFSGISNGDGITATDAALGLWDGITFKDVVNNNNNVFSFGSATSLIRGWDFKNCEFIAARRCFKTAGTLLCSEFTFENCAFLQCHTLLYNNNTQAVNWEFYGCDWENDSLVFSGDNATSSLLFCDKGTFLTWNGGSVVTQGSLVFCNWTAAGDAFRGSHKVNFNSTRIEVHPTSESTNPRLVERVLTGYVTASNSMPVLFSGCTGLIRGGVATPYVWANVWNKSSLSIVKSEFTAGEIHGLYDSNTESSTGELIIDNNVSLKYVDDPSSSKLSAYINHFVDIKHDSSQDSDGFDINQRNATTVCSNSEKIIRLRSASGRIPLANTETILPEIPENATVISIGYRRLQVANTGQSFTAELRSSDGVTLYSTVTLANNQRVSDSDVLLESGIDIVTDLKVTFTGTPEIASGYFEIRYV